MMQADNAPEIISHEDWDALRRAEILKEGDDKRNVSEILDRLVTHEQAARFFNWRTDDEAFDTKRVQREIRRGALPHSRRFGLWTRVTVGDLLHYDDPPRPPIVRPSLWRIVADHPLFAILGIPLAFLAVITGIFSQEIHWILSPPRTTLTFILDGSLTMGQPFSGSTTAWDVQRNIVKQKLPIAEFSGNEWVAIWVQRSLSQTSGGCQDDFELRTDGYQPADQINLDALLQEPKFDGETSPGKALLTAAARMPRFSLHPITHRAIVLSNSRRTCRGLRPIDEVCAYVADIAFYWSTRSNAKLEHEILVIDFGAQEVASNENPCGNVPSIEITSVDLDPRQPDASEEKLCLIDAKLCLGRSLQPSVLMPTATSTPGNPTPPIAVPTFTSTIPNPTGQAPNLRPAVATALTATPTPMPTLKLRSLKGRRAALTEGCNQGRVIGEIGELEDPHLYLEAEVVAIPRDLEFLQSNGCVRVFSGILGDPIHGYAGYVQANDVCIAAPSYDYWIGQPVFLKTPGVVRLVRCTS